MSGIAGILHLDGAPVEPTHLAAMLGAMAHRGSDGSGQRVMGPVGLGQCLLVTTPESVGEQQPIRDPETDCWLVGDLRIDNRDEILRLVENANLRLPVRTDAELALCAYRIWGDQLAAKLLGDFAFALWDGRCRRLICARDPLGMKPFYYYLDDQRFLFASEIKALFACPDPVRRPNEVLMGLYLADDYSEKEQTLYLGVLRLPAAHRLIVEGGHCWKTRYWDVHLDHPIRYGKEEEYAEQFRDLFSRAVECRLRSSHPVGAFLSGGLDSSSVVSMAQHIYEKTGQGKTLETFSAYLLNPPCDERAYIEETARRWRIQAHYSPLDDVGPSTYAEEMAAQFEGIYDPTLCLLQALAEKTRAHNVRVVLTGNGGDEFVGGSPLVFADLLRQGRLQDVYRQINLCAQTLSLNRRTLWIHYTLLPFLPELIKSPLRRFRRRLRKGYPPWIDPGFAKRIDLADRLARDRPSPPHGSRAQRSCYQILHDGYWAHVVEILNALAGTQQLEFRFPFADSRLVDFALRIPGENFLRGDMTKWLLRVALKGILPELIRCRKKKTLFDSVVGYDIRTRDFVAGILNSLQLARDGYIDVREAQRLYEQVRQGRSRQGYKLYSIVGLELWYRRYGGNSGRVRGEEGMVQDKAPETRSSAEKRKHYEKPQLTAHGNLRELTQGGPSLPGDMGARKSAVS